MTLETALRFFLSKCLPSASSFCVQQRARGVLETAPRRNLEPHLPTWAEATSLGSRASIPTMVYLLRANYLPGSEYIITANAPMIFIVLVIVLRVVAQVLYID